MLQLVNRPPSRMLMTVDAVGGVWRYAMTLARSLGTHGVETAFLSFGPEPGPEKRREAAAIGPLSCTSAPLDWMAATAGELSGVAGAIGGAAEAADAELIHLNLPSQAAELDAVQPVVAVSHSCVTSWFKAVRRSPLPADWAWQADLNGLGLARADAVVAPSRSHGELLAQCYGPIANLAVVPNASSGHADTADKSLPFVFAAGRWWDEAKDAVTLDTVGELSMWPILAAGATQGPQGQSHSFSHVRSLGERDHDTVRGIAAHAPIFISPSVYEPFGLAVLEAAQTGAALVLADIPTYRELWEGAALFAQPGDAKGFAHAINRFVENHTLRQVMGTRAAERAERYSVEAQAEAMLGVYALAATRAQSRSQLRPAQPSAGDMPNV
jgi:glycosyltransferase involved in cell wall biosynthesis